MFGREKRTELRGIETVYEINYETVREINCKNITDRPGEINESIDGNFRTDGNFLFCIVQMDVCNGLETLRAPIAQATKSCKVNDTFKDQCVG